MWLSKEKYLKGGGGILDHTVRIHLNMGDRIISKVFDGLSGVLPADIHALLIYGDGDQGSYFMNLGYSLLGVWAKISSASMTIGAARIWTHVCALRDLIHC